MTLTLAQITRHPIKSHGRETLASVVLSAGQCMPWDRHWAVTHERTKFDAANPEWVSCVNFMIGSKLPALMAIDMSWNEGSASLTLRHPARPDVTFAPDTAAGQALFINWVRPLCTPDHPPAQALVSIPGRGVTDTEYPSVSILNTASNADLGMRMGLDLSPNRWRGNLWVDGAQAWAEQGWIGKDIRIGATLLHVEEPIKRCKATTTNPATGLRDADTLAALRAAFDHQNFGVYARVVEGSVIALGDKIEVLA